MKLLVKLGGALFLLWMFLRNIRSAQFHVQSPLGEWTFVKRPPADKKKIGQIARIIRDKRTQGKEE